MRKVHVKPMELKNLENEKPRPMRLHSETSKNYIDVILASKKGLKDVLKSYERDGIIDKMNDGGNNALHLATRHNDVVMMGMLLDSGANINLQGNNGYTPLHFAARFNCIDAAKLLLERNADATIQCDVNSLPLHLASRLGFIDIVTLLLNKDTSKETVNAKGPGHVTPLYLATKNGDRALCEKLVENKADITIVTPENHTLLYLAASDGHLEVVKFLIEVASKKLINVKEYIEIAELEGRTPLHVASFMGYDKIVHELLVHGANLHAQSMASKDSALHVAVRGGNLKVIEELLDHGAAIEVVNMDHRTPLHKAALSNRTDLVKFLLDKGAKIDPGDTSRLTPFLLSVQKGNTEVATLLLERGANMKAVDMDLRTCFHLAVMCKCPKTLVMLFKKDCDSLKEKTELHIQKPLHYAAAAGNIEVLNLLLKHQSRHDALDENEMTPLHVAALSGEIHATEILVRAAPRCLGYKDIHGRTPLHCAAEKGFKKTCALLLDLHAPLNLRDLKRRSPLHTAVKAGALKIVKLLLALKDSRLLGMLDINENSALHLACAQEEVDIVEALLDANADVAVLNREGKTCLDLAIDWELENVAIVLVQHKRWMEIMSTKDKDGYGPMKKLIQVLPNVAKIALDQSVELNNMPTNHPDYSVKLCVMLLDPGPDDEPSLRGEPYEGPATMVKHNREELLNHPVTQALLRYKWFAFGELPFYLNLSLFLILTVLFSYFIISERDKILLHYPNTPNATSEAIRQLKDGQTGSSHTQAVVLIVLTCIELLKELYQMMMLKLDYFKDISNYIEVTIYVTALIFLIPYLEGKPMYISPSVQWNAGVVAMFLLYVDLLLFVRRVASGGIYVSMYFEVWYTFLRVLAVFLVVIFGCTLVFYVLLKEEDNFSNIGFSFVKTTVMMVGELDYTDVLTDNVVNKKINPATGTPYVPLPAITYVVFFLFMIAVPVLLMNLLVGLAVGDIEAIQKSAAFSRLKDEVKFVVDAQKRYPHALRRYLYKDTLVIKPNVNKILKSFLFAGSGSITDQSYFDKLVELKPKTTKNQETDEQTLQWERQKSKLNDLEEKLEKQNKLMLAIAEKLGIQTKDEEDDTEL